MKALIIIDMQNDFCPGGALEVKEGDLIIPVINRLQDHFDLVIATQDWHPKSHESFASNHRGKNVFEKIDLHGLDQVLWPDHCIQGTKGAEFHKDLQVNRIEAIFRKGMDPTIDSYSGFYDNGHKKDTGLTGYLRARKIDEIYFCGLAADYCVYYSIKDALMNAFKVSLVLDATQPIEPVQFDQYKIELEEKGVNNLYSQDL